MKYSCPSGVVSIHSRASIEARLLEPPKMRPEKEKFLRNTSFYGQVTTMDKQGRILVQPHLRAKAGIDGDVAVMGQLRYLEVWNQEKFLQKLESEPFTKEDAIALADLGI